MYRIFNVWQSFLLHWWQTLSIYICVPKSCVRCVVELYTRGVAQGWLEGWLEVEKRRFRKGAHDYYTEVLSRLGAHLLARRIIKKV